MFPNFLSEIPSLIRCSLLKHTAYEVGQEMNINRQVISLFKCS